MRILLTAFEPYGEWRENSSWLALIEMLKSRPGSAELVTRRYPVDLNSLQSKLQDDLQKHPDAVLHLGQSPGASAVKLEAVALNIAGCIDDHGQVLPELVEQGAVAYRSQMPLGPWAEKLRAAGIPTVVSYHAGTFLCNATMYLTHHWFQLHGERHKQIGFVHLPLATEQVVGSNRNLASLPVATLATAVRILVDELASQPAADEHVA